MGVPIPLMMLAMSRRSLEIGQMQHIFMHEGINGDVKGEQDAGTDQNPGIGRFARIARRMTATMVMAVDPVAAQVHAPADCEHQAGYDDDRHFVSMDVFVPVENKARQYGDKAKVRGKTQDCKQRWQDATEDMAEFRN